MGNSESELQTQSIDHSKFGKISVENLEKKPFMTPIFSVPNEQVLQEWEAELAKAKKSKSREYTLLPEQYKSVPVPCGLAQNLKIWFPYFPFDLQFQIHNRIKLNVLFKETEIFYLLYNLLTVSHQFQLDQQKSGNIKPSNILINSEGDIKIITKQSYPGFLDSYKTVLLENQKAFVAPEEIGFIKKASFSTPTYSLPKTESFSIGLTILSTALMSNLLSLYSEDVTFDVVSFQKSLKAWKQHEKYSNFLKEIVLMLVNLDPKGRISPGQLLAYISPYQQQIKKGDKFQPNEIESLQALSSYMKNPNAEIVSQIPRTRISIHTLGGGVREKILLAKDKTLQKINPVPFHHTQLVDQSTLTTKGEYDRTHNPRPNIQKLSPKPAPIIKKRVKQEQHKESETETDREIGKKLETIGEEDTSVNIQSIINEFKHSLQQSYHQRQSTE